MKFCSFEDVLTFLDERSMFHMDLELNRMQRAIERLHLAPGTDGWHPLVVQIVGTNGKGSTSTFLASLARAHGLVTGLYTSPHFVTPRERIRLNGSMLPAEAYPELAERVYAASPDLTYFEFLTVLGLLAFKEARAEFVVLEAGLGGHYDATTAIHADLVCFAPIALDHTHILGSTLADIATDKAHAIRSGGCAITGTQPDEVAAVLRAFAASRSSVLLSAQALAQLPEGAELGIAGPHQGMNAALALAAWRVAAEKKGWMTDEGAVRAGLRAARISGRFQRVPAAAGDPPYILDGAHNPHGLKACRDAVRAGNIRLRAVIFSCLSDKDVDTMLPLVAELSRRTTLFIPTIQDNERAMDGADLAERFRDLAGKDGSQEIRSVSRLGEALGEVVNLPCDAPEDPVLICGSLYLLGEFFTLRPTWLF